jgi:hypothetical protein
MYGAYSQTMSLARTANLLGAIALGLADDILEIAEGMLLTVAAPRRRSA